MKKWKTQVDSYYDSLPEESKEFLDKAIASIIEAKKRGGKVVVATGSGPNLHEGVTTLIAHLMDKGIVDGVTTSSAVIAHEMGGTLDRVKRIPVPGSKVEGLVDPDKLPRNDIFELTMMEDAEWKALEKEMWIDKELVTACEESDGQVIIKAAGNMAYPMGLRTETVSNTVLEVARACGRPFEEVVGWGCDRKTMLGMGAEKGLPVLVSIPQLVGGGYVGIAIGDSISINERSARIADMMASADVIIESAVVLTQEIHDGPLETFTGHGIWSHWNGLNTYSLKEKSLIRFDLDDNLKRAWDMDKKGGDIQRAIEQGLPKTKMSKIPFRMEMSAFSRLEKSIPVIGDIGVLWPIVAYRVAEALDINLEFLSHPQQTEEGKAMREKIVSDTHALDLEKLYAVSRNHKFH
ncbi:MAG: hypothetical protein WC233_05100 [Sphaerochaeta sp.]|jgi:hypothetical protein